jgi:hypothetical protein
VTSVVTQYGLIPCDELLRCVKVDACEHCDPRMPDIALVLGRAYRATGRDPHGVGGWFIPEVCQEVPDPRIPGGTCVSLICPPHMAPFDEGEQLTEIKERIRRCKPVRETEEV